MSRKLVLAAALLLTIGSAAPAQEAGATLKGFELYSWKVKGTWYYSLLPATNRVKTYEEITLPSAVRKGTAGLEAELKKLPKGGQIFWQSGAKSVPLGPAAAPAIDFKQPSRDRIKQIKKICDKLGITLTLT